jgi:hypothetical protein
MTDKRIEKCTVTATQLAEHLDLTRQRIGVLADVEQVFERLPDGRFDADRCRVQYIRHLRSERARSPRHAADAEHVKAKTRDLQLRIAQRERTLIQVEDALEVVDTLCGMFLTGLSALPSRASRDPKVRREVETACRELQQQISAKAREHTSEVRKGQAA